MKNLKSVRELYSLSGKYIYVYFYHEGSTKSFTDKNIKLRGQEVCTRT